MSERKLEEKVKREQIQRRRKEEKEARRRGVKSFVKLDELVVKQEMGTRSSSLYQGDFRENRNEV